MTHYNICTLDLTCSEFKGQKEPMCCSFCKKNTRCKSVCHNSPSKCGCYMRKVWKGDYTLDVV